LKSWTYSKSSIWGNI